MILNLFSYTYVLGSKNTRKALYFNIQKIMKIQDITLHLHSVARNNLQIIQINFC